MTKSKISFELQATIVYTGKGVACDLKIICLNFPPRFAVVEFFQIKERIGTEIMENFLQDMCLGTYYLSILAQLMRLTCM